MRERSATVYLWVFTLGSVIFILAEGGRTTCPRSTWGVRVPGIMVVDRYRRIRRSTRSERADILAFCWAHVRRDFLTLARSWPDQRRGVGWVERIGGLYQLMMPA